MGHFRTKSTKSRAILHMAEQVSDYLMARLGMLNRERIGRLGQNAAESYLTLQGLRVLERNWRCRVGEIDLIMQDNNDLVFVEVKTRKIPKMNLTGSQVWEDVFQNVNAQKRRKLLALVSIYLNRASSKRFPSFRVDLVGVWLGANNGRIIKILHEPSAV